MNSENAFVVDATFLLGASREAFLGAPILMVDGEDQTCLYGAVRDFLRLRKVLGINLCLLIIGKDAYSVATRSQVENAASFLRNLGIAVIHEPGFRVLDLCASLAEHATHFVTKNRSLLFLAEKTRAVVLIGDRNEPSIYTAPTVASKIGVTTSAIPSFLALADGKKPAILTKRQAVALLEHHPDLTEIFEDPSVLSSRRIERKLVENKAMLLHRLMKYSVSTDLPIPDRYTAPTRIVVDNDRCVALLEARYFYSLVRLLPAPTKITPSIASGKPHSENFQAIQTPEALALLVPRIIASEYCAVDTETSDKNPHAAELYGVSFSVKKDEAFYLPIVEPHLRGLDKDSVLSALKKMLEGKTKIIGHNLKYDYLLLRRHGIEIKTCHFDTMLAAYDAFGDAGLLNLPFVTKKLLGKTIKSYKETVANERNLLEVPFGELVTHACADADATLQIFPHLEKEIERRGIRSEYQNTTLSLALQLADWEYEGVPVNRKKLSKVRSVLQENTATLRQSVEKEAGFPFNVDSDKEVLAVFLSIPGLNEAIEKRKLTMRLLESLAISHNLPRRVLEYRRQQRQVRHAEEVIKAVRDEKLYPRFSQTRSAYGRVSSVSPRLFEDWLHPMVLSCVEHPVAGHFRLVDKSLDIIQRLAKDDILREDRLSGIRAAFSSFHAETLPHGLCYEDLLLSFMVDLPSETICRAHCLLQGAVAALRHDMELRYARSFEWLDNYRKAVDKTGMARADARTRWFNGVKSSNLSIREKTIRASVQWLLKY